MPYSYNNNNNNNNNNGIAVVLEFVHRPILKLETTMFRKQDLFLSSGGGRKTPTLLGPLERANLNHWTG
jgi:hypothetical protein